MTIDASVFVSAARPADAHHVQSAAFLTRVRSLRLRVTCPVLVLIECAGAVARITGNADMGLRAASDIEQLRQARLVPISGRRADRAVRLAAANRLRGADAVYAAVSEEYGLPLITWDQELLQRASAVVRTMTPTEWLAANPVR